MSNRFQGQRVTIFGLGRHGGGVGAARYVARHGACVTICDAANEATLRESIAQLADVPIERYFLGGPDSAAFESADLVVINPAIPPHHPLLAEIRAAGAPITTEIDLFLDACPARVIAVTGTVGKSTTVSLIAHILNETGRQCHLGGNLGGSLLCELDEINAGDWVALELSSFQLARLARKARFEITLILNCAPNHLDWHADFADYAQAKQRLLSLVSPTGAAVLNLSDPVVASWANLSPVRVVRPVEANVIPPLPMMGEHQIQNAACALAAVFEIGCPRAEALAAIEAFKPLDHRLTLIGEVDGRRCYDDSKATTPAAMLAALNSISEPVWLLAGGRAKEVGLNQLAAELAERIGSTNSSLHGVACFGECGPQLYAHLTQHSVSGSSFKTDDEPISGATAKVFSSAVTKVALLGKPAVAPKSGFETASTQSCSCHGSLSEAFAWCLSHSAPGEAILLSPACSSHDQYSDFTARARDFLNCIRLAQNKVARSEVAQ